MTRRRPSFGQYVRAARLGYHRVDLLRAFVRMASTAGPFPATILVSIVPFDRDIPLKGPAAAKNLYRCWWEDDPDYYLRECEPLAYYASNGPPAEITHLLVDDEGQLVQVLKGG